MGDKKNKYMQVNLSWFYLIVKYEDGVFAEINTPLPCQRCALRAFKKIKKKFWQCNRIDSVSTLETSAWDAFL